MSDRRYWWVVPLALSGKAHAVQRWTTDRTTFEAACSLTITAETGGQLTQDVSARACKNCLKATDEGNKDYASRPKG